MSIFLVEHENPMSTGKICDAKLRLGVSPESCKTKVHHHIWQYIDKRRSEKIWGQTHATLLQFYSMSLLSAKQCKRIFSHSKPHNYR